MCCLAALVVLFRFSGDYPKGRFAEPTIQESNQGVKTLYSPGNAFAKSAIRQRFGWMQMHHSHARPPRRMFKELNTFLSDPAKLAMAVSK